MEIAESAIDLINTWQDQVEEFKERDEINHVLLFENRGEAVGVSNPHPHCQLYATNFVFKTIENEDHEETNMWLCFWTVFGLF